MSTSVTDIAEWIRGLSGTSGDASAEPTRDSDATARDAAGSALFQCSECRSVYVAAEKTTCDGCGTPVERVASTLSTGD